MKIDLVSVERTTNEAKYQAEETIKAALLFMGDPTKFERVTRSLCKVCYYIYTSRIGGSSITSRPCGICEKAQTYCNTCTDALCMECAQSNKLCKHCGADRELKHRRNFVLNYPDEKEASLPSR